MRRAVELVNVVHQWSGDRDGLRARLEATLVEQGEPDVSGVAAELDALTEVARRLRAVLAEDDRDRAALRLNALLADHATVPQLARHGGWDWHVHADGGADAPWATWFGASAALALAELLCDHAELPWGICESPPCERAYTHDGRGARRRCCSTACATRARVRRHRARAT